MTTVLSPARQRLQRQYRTERIDEYTAAEYCGYRIKGGPSDARVQEWRRESAELDRAEREERE
jgi:hypothetical protein